MAASTILLARPQTPARRDAWQQKSRRPRLGTSGVQLVVPPHFAAPWRTRPQFLPRHASSGAGISRHDCSLTGTVPSPPTERVIPLFGARLRGLLLRRSWSRFAATAVLWPAPAGYSSSSWPVVVQLSPSRLAESFACVKRHPRVGSTPYSFPLPFRRVKGRHDADDSICRRI
jgi:hypothetical protein